MDIKNLKKLAGNFKLYIVIPFITEFEHLIFSSYIPLLHMRNYNLDFEENIHFKEEPKANVAISCYWYI